MNDNNNSNICVSGEVSDLRAEILESQKARSDLLKYKLIATATLAAIALGFGEYNGGSKQIDSLYVICVIPFVCIYVDLLCWHNNIRILVIGRFLDLNSDPYEKFISDMNAKCKKGDDHFFEMENWALHYFSIMLSFIIGIASLYYYHLTDRTDLGFAFCGAGIIGMAFPLIIHNTYKKKVKLLFDAAEEIKKQKIFNSMLKQKYATTNISEIFIFLKKHNTFYFRTLKNGLFPAAHLQTESEYTGYSNVWVRDNIHIAHAHYINSYTNIALKNITAFSDYFIKHQWRFEKIISGALAFDNPMNRPHIRFNGNDLSEIGEKWSHAQNDALGYFLWFFCKLYNDGVITELTPPQSRLLALFALYFDKIRYWQDEDNGHWEEAKKIQASSIGVVVAALIELKTVLQRETSLIQYNDKIITAGFLAELIDKGQQSLKQILPAECIQAEKYRSYDAALLFLIFPLDVIKDEGIENQILENVIAHLQGDYGIRRYRGDSYWSADYKEKVKPEQRTINVSDDMRSRDSLLKRGQEAQWCIFDPIVSVIYGKKYQNTHKTEYLQLQTHYFNRSLMQLTPEDSPFGGFKCPELYYLEKDKYVPNDATPLLWTQANLWVAFNYMEQSAALLVE